jgi:hypothetical protein
MHCIWSRPRRRGLFRLILNLQPQKVITVCGRPRPVSKRYDGVRYMNVINVLSNESTMHIMLIRSGQVRLVPSRPVRSCPVLSGRRSTADPSVIYGGKQIVRRYNGGRVTRFIINRAPSSCVYVCSRIRNTLSWNECLVVLKSASQNCHNRSLGSEEAATATSEAPIERATEGDPMTDSSVLFKQVAAGKWLQQRSLGNRVAMETSRPQKATRGPLVNEQRNFNFVGPPLSRDVFNILDFTGDKFYSHILDRISVFSWSRSDGVRSLVKLLSPIWGSNLETTEPGALRPRTAFAHAGRRAGGGQTV